MRFELLLSALPNLSPEQAKDELASFPKGLITGVIIKALQERRLPSVAVAWSEDKRVLNEIADRLSALGAESYVVDHAFFPFRMATWVAEKAAGDSYRRAPKDDRRFVKVGSDESVARSSAAVQFLVHFGMQLAVVEGLLIWRMTNQVGSQQVWSAPWLIPQLAACAGGLAAANVLTATFVAFRNGRLKLQTAIPIALVPVATTVVALFFLNAGLPEEKGKEALGRPPSNPYAGLLVELRRRKLEGALAQTDKVSSAAAPLAEDELMCLDDTGFELGRRECLAGQPWDLTLSCLPMPKLPPLPPLKVVRAPEEVASAPVVVAKRVKVVRPWGVRFELVHLSSLLLFWMLSLVGLQLWWMRRTKGAGSGPSADAAAGDATSGNEVQRLRAQLAEAEAAVAAQAFAPLGAAGAGDPHRVSELQRELAETQAALEAHRTAVAQFRQQIGPVRELHAAQTAEIERLTQELHRAKAQRPAAAQGQLRSAEQAAAPANNQGTFRRPAAPAVTGVEPGGRGGSVYSGGAGQEERIAPPKRRP